MFDTQKSLQRFGGGRKVIKKEEFRGVRYKGFIESRVEFGFEVAKEREREVPMIYVLFSCIILKIFQFPLGGHWAR